MAAKVTTTYRTSFTMPSFCVSCGAPPGGSFLKVRADAGLQRTTYVSVHFPLCEECGRANRSLRTVRLLRWLLVPASLLLLVILGVSLGVLGWALGAVVVAAVVWLLRQLDLVGLTAEQRSRRRTVRRAAKLSFKPPGALSKGWMRFTFRNSDFAEAFAALNIGELEVGPSRSERKGPTQTPSHV